MDNQYQLVLRIQHANLSRSLQRLGATYTNRFNARHSRSSHLFRGRFKTMPAQNDATRFMPTGSWRRSGSTASDRLCR
jgi:hypothetical protein